MTDLFTPVETPLEPTMFDEMTKDVWEQNRVALPSETLTLALSKMSSDDTTIGLQEKAINEARTTIETGQSLVVRNRIASDRKLAQLSHLNDLRGDAGISTMFNADMQKDIDTSYQNILNEDDRKLAQAAAEKQAVDNIHMMAARDPVQAQVLLDNLEKGDTLQTMRDFQAKMLILSQVADSLDNEYQQSGWGRWVINQVFGLIPLNFNASRTGLVEGVDDSFLQPGTSVQRQGEALWNMSAEDLAEFAKGPLMESIRANASTFGVYDPGLATDLAESLKYQSDTDRDWANFWGGIEIASIVPVSKVAGATKLLVRSGARKEAVDNLGKALSMLETNTMDDITRATGVNATELELGSSIRIGNAASGTDSSVSLGIDLETRRQAALDAINNMAETIQVEQLSSGELASAFSQLQEEAAEKLGREVKDISFAQKVEVLADGRKQHYLEAVIGKKAGGGYATEAQAQKYLTTKGISGEVFRDESGQWFGRTRVNMVANQFYTSDLAPEAKGFLSRMMGTWDVRSAARHVDPALHGKAVAAESAVSRLQRVIGENLRASIQSIPTESQEMIKQVALKGQNNKRWFSETEFRTLGEAYLSRPVTAAEEAAYQKVQLFNDIDWVIRNDVEYSKKVSQGYENAKFVSKWGEVFDVDAHISYNPSVRPKERVYNMTDNIHYTSQNNPLSLEELERLSKDGYIMLRVPGGVKLPGDITVDRVLVKRNEVEIGPVSRQQLAYSEGGHRMYTDKYFVKQAQWGRQGDTGTAFLKSPNAFITAPNIVEARKWAEVMERARLLVKGNRDQVTEQQLDEILAGGAHPSGREFLDKVDDGFIDLDSPFEALFDRELPSAYRGNTGEFEKFIDEDEFGYNGYYRTTGKLYTSGKGDILKDYKGDLAPTVDPYDALTISLRNVTRQSGLFNYKEESIGRFLKTYGDDLEVTSRDNVSDLQKFIDGTVKRGVPADRVAEIELQRDAIKSVIGFETPGEKAASERYRTVAESIAQSGPLGEKAANAVWWWKEKNPVSVMRGLAFDAKLGMFNIGQLLIQSSTMFSAMALNPKYGMHGMSTVWSLWPYLLKRGDENMLESSVKMGMHKLAGFNDPAEFKDYARFIYRSGFTDVNGNHIMIGDNGPTAAFGSFVENQQRFREKARMFFYTAETWNRLVAMRIGYGEAVEQGLKRNTPEFHAAVMKASSDYSFNMDQASAAWWQKGVLSIPTQFWAYNARMLDAMFGKRFTGSQKARLALMNIMLAGSAGVPFLEGVSSYTKEKYGKGPEIDTLAGTLDRGFIDRLTYELTGADVRLGEKFGTGGWVTDTVKTFFGASEYGETSPAEFLGGASYSIIGGGVESIIEAGKYAFAESGGEMGADAISGEAFGRMLNEISTVGNITKALMVANYGVYKSKRGAILADDLPEENAFFVALGYRPEKTVQTGYMMSYLKNQSEVRKDAVRILKNWRQEAFNVPEKKQENAKKANAFMQLLPPDMRRSVIKQVNRETEDSLYDSVKISYDKANVEDVEQ